MKRKKFYAFVDAIYWFLIRSQTPLCSIKNLEKGKANKIDNDSFFSFIGDRSALPPDLNSMRNQIS